ncbi:hypothetical protein [Thalassotalea euphylliae]|uniref:DUF3278 domain-containing protein n=1 Tax=Thalassotalea euphylliae TaxID=1655234 RepID=A0A3E0UCV0_9GAMM|nr:hypothetical protein [Thalassotalea euphylliae]REL34726.1 hypothetical protein DXX92_04815 [Thalassotalea euphylliae]
MTDKQLTDVELHEMQTGEPSVLDEQWSELVDDWQSQPYEKVDITQLVKQLKKRTLAAKTVLGLDVLATISLFGALVYSLSEQVIDWATVIYLSFGAFGSLVYTVIEFNIRIKTWRMDASDPKQAFEKNISGIKGAIQFANLWLISCFAILPIGNWYIWEISKTSEKPIWPAYLFANLLIVVMLVGAYLYKRKRVKELNELNEIING